MRQSEREQRKEIDEAIRGMEEALAQANGRLTQRIKRRLKAAKEEESASEQSAG